MSLGVILRVLDGEMDQFMPKNSYKVPARRSSERTRLIFLDAAEKIFSERGYEGTTIRAIWVAAPVSSSSGDWLIPTSSRSSSSCRPGSSSEQGRALTAQTRLDLYGDGNHSTSSRTLVGTGEDPQRRAQ